MNYVIALVIIFLVYIQTLLSDIYTLKEKGSITTYGYAYIFVISTILIFSVLQIVNSYDYEKEYSHPWRDEVTGSFEFNVKLDEALLKSFINPPPDNKWIPFNETNKYFGKVEFDISMVIYKKRKDKHGVIILKSKSFFLSEIDNSMNEPYNTFIKQFGVKKNDNELIISIPKQKLELEITSNASSNTEYLCESKIKTILTISVFNQKESISYVFPKSLVKSKVWLTPFSKVEISETKHTDGEYHVSKCEIY